MTLYEVLVRENALTEHIKLDISDIIDDIRPKQNPMLTMHMKVGKESASEFTSYWMEEGPIPTEVKFTGATESSAGTTLVFSDYTRLRKHDVLKRRESPFEYLLVTATPTTSDVTVSRDLYSYTGGSGLLKNGEILDIVDSLREDITADVTPRGTKPILKYNYQSKVIDWVKLDKDYTKVAHRGGDITSRRINAITDHHMMKLEKNFALGVRGAATYPSGTYYARSSGGMTYFLATNKWDVNGLDKFTPATFGAWVERVASRDPEQSELTYYCSRTERGIISRWGHAKLALNREESKRYGVTVEEFDAGAGTIVNLVTVPWFRGVNAGLGFLVNLNKMQCKQLWATEMEMNVQDKKEEYTLHKIKTTSSLIIHNEETMGWHFNAL